MSETRDVKKYKGKFLIEEPPTMFQTTLANIFGLHEAILLQRLYWVTKNPYHEGEQLRVKVDQEGRRWVRVPPRVIDGTLPFISAKTRQRAINSCREQKIIITVPLDKQFGDQTNFYYVNHEEIERREQEYEDALEPPSDFDGPKPEGFTWPTALGQNDPMHQVTTQIDLMQIDNLSESVDKMTSSMGSNCPYRDEVKMTRSLGNNHIPIPNNQQQQNAREHALDDDVDFRAQRMNGENSGASPREPSPPVAPPPNPLADKLFEIGLRPRRLCEALAADQHAVEGAVISREQVERQLSYWPARHEAGADYLQALAARGRPTTHGAILRRCIEEDRAAPAALMPGQNKAEKAEETDAVCATLAAEKPLSDKFWASLSAAQREAFKHDWNTEWMTRHPGRFFNARDPLHLLEQVRELNTEKTREWLAALNDPNATRRDFAAALAAGGGPPPEMTTAVEAGESDKFEDDDGEENGAPSDEEYARVLATRLVTLIRDNVIGVEELDEQRAKNFLDEPRYDALWAQVHGEVLAEVGAQAEAKAA